MRPVVTLDSEAAGALSTESTASADGSETGGILLGNDAGGSLHVSVAGGPGPNAKRSPRRFLRDLEHARALADDAYNRDGSVWIGEWHTHPTGPAAPSGLDLVTYARHLADETLGFQRFLSLIVLPCSLHGWDHVRVAAWIIEKDGDLVAADLRVVRGDPD